METILFEWKYERKIDTMCEGVAISGSRGSRGHLCFICSRILCAVKVQWGCEWSRCKVKKVKAQEDAERERPFAIIRSLEKKVFYIFYADNVQSWRKIFLFLETRKNSIIIRYIIIMKKNDTRKMFIEIII